MKQPSDTAVACLALVKSLAAHGLQTTAGPHLADMEKALDLNCVGLMPPAGEGGRWSAIFDLENDDGTLLTMAVPPAGWQ